MSEGKRTHGVGEVSALGYYSALERAVMRLPVKEAGAQAWREQLQGLVNRGAVKAQELRWSGLVEWLDGQSGRVAREEILAQVAGAQNDVLETRYYGRVESKPDSANLPGAQYEELSPGACTGYREILLALPPAERAPLFHVLSKSERALLFRAESHDQAQQWLDEHQGLPAARDARIVEKPGGQPVRPEYHAGHWPVPNVLVHLRVADVFQPDGQRCLYVQEIQSDWGQSGRNEGFAWPQLGPRLSAEQHSHALELQRLGDDGRTADQQLEFKALMEQHRRSIPRGGYAPRAPFVESTGGWVALALKRVAAIAVHEGYDSVAVASGEQVARMNGVSCRSENMRADQQQRGMRVFYDEIVPLVMADMLRKTTREKVVPVGIEMECGVVELPGFQVSQDLKSHVQSEGFPLFSISADDKECHDRARMRG